MQWEAIYIIAERAGMPSKVLTAYRDCQEGLRMRNSIMGRVGVGYG